MNGARFHSTLRAALERQDISHRDKVVFAVLLDAADSAGLAWPAAATVAQRAGILERAARASLRRLRLAGLIVETAPGGGSRATKYRVVALPSPDDLSGVTPDDLSGVTPDDLSGVTPDDLSGDPCQNVPSPLTKRTVTPDETSPYRLNTVSLPTQLPSHSAPDLLGDQHPALGKPARRGKRGPKTPTEAAIRIYLAYPRKAARPDALQAIDCAIARIGARSDELADPAAWLLDRVNLYSAAVATWPVADRQFIPHPATWFRKDRFDDDETDWRRNGRGSDPSRCGEVSPESLARIAAKVQS